MGPAYKKAVRYLDGKNKESIKKENQSTSQL
jgi:hypothetical protein